MSEHGTQLRELLKQVEGGRDVLDAMDHEPAPRGPETEEARKIREEGAAMHLEREGLVRRGSRGLPGNFWDLPRPHDPGDSVRRALTEDRR